MGQGFRLLLLMGDAVMLPPPNGYANAAVQRYGCLPAYTRQLYSVPWMVRANGLVPLKTTSRGSLDGNPGAFFLPANELGKNSVVLPVRQIQWL
jgi:hypothetical protein